MLKETSEKSGVSLYFLGFRVDIFATYLYN